MNVKILVGRAFGKRVVAVDFGDVAIVLDEEGNVAKLVGDKTYVAEWREGGSDARIFLPREEEIGGVMKRIENGELVVEWGKWRLGRVIEIPE
jgi:hypothetical protein